MNLKKLALVAVMTAAGFMTPEKSAEAGLNKLINKLVGVGGSSHSRGHWDVWYYGFNGYWGWHVYRSCHTECEAAQARSYLWGIGFTSAYYTYHH